MIKLSKSEPKSVNAFKIDPLLNEINSKLIINIADETPYFIEAIFDLADLMNKKKTAHIEKICLNSIQGLKIQDILVMWQ